MKARIIEHDSMFELIIEPETQDELAQIIRAGMNVTKERISIYTHVYKNLTSMFYMIISKRKRATSEIAGRKA